MTPAVAVVLVNWNGWRDTVECLESLFRSPYPNYFAVVCDNASKDDSVARIREWATAPPKPLVLLETGANLGFAGGNNAGIRYALEHGADYVWLLNNDTVVEPDAMAALVAHMQADGGIGICGATLLEYAAPHRLQARGGCRYHRWSARSEPVAGPEPRGAMDYVAGASMFVRRSFIEAVGLMQTDYFLYFEELDWAIRGRGRFALGYCAAARVYHKESGSIGSSGGSRHSLTAEYFGSRNRLRVTGRFWPWCLPAVVVGLLSRVAHRLLLRRWTHALYILAAMAGVPAERLRKLRRLYV